MAIGWGWRRLVPDCSPAPWFRVRREAMPRSHRHPCLLLWSPLSTQPKPHRVLHSASGPDPSQPPPIHAPGWGGASFHHQAAQTPPKHRALETPRSAHDGRQHCCRGSYGLVGPQASPASLSCVVAYVVAAGQRQQGWGSSTDDADPAPGYHRCHPGQPHRPHPQAPPTSRLLQPRRRGSQGRPHNPHWTRPVQSPSRTRGDGDWPHV